MKTTIYISKRLVITILFLAIGVYCTLYGILSLYREFRCVPIKELTIDNYRKGVYVAGTVDSCLTINVSSKDLGVPVSFITGRGIFDCYTIPMADSHYTRIMTPDKDTKDAMEDLIDGNNEGVYMEGQIVREMTERNIAWYEHCEQIRNPQEEVLDGYEIRQISFSNRRNVLYFGLGWSAVMILVIWKGKMIAEAYDVEEEPEKRQVEKVENSEFEPWKPQYQSRAEDETLEMEKE